jgi:nucleotide-binding universal stress UspA family protein
VKIGASPDNGHKARHQDKDKTFDHRRPTMKKILIATDGSASSVEAVALGVELAEEHEAQLILVHVGPTTDVLPMAGYAFGSVAHAPHKPTNDDRLSLEAAVKIASEHGIKATAKLLFGDTVDEIVAYADNQDVDMIVVGSRGNGTLAGVLLGSVSRGILAESKRPVMVVRSETKSPVAA